MSFIYFKVAGGFYSLCLVIKVCDISICSSKSKKDTVVYPQSIQFSITYTWCLNVDFSPKKKRVIDMGIFYTKDSYGVCVFSNNVCGRRFFRYTL